MRPLVPTNGLAGAALNKAGMPSVQATLRAMESAGVVRTLAEPNLTAIPASSATFISAANFQFRPASPRRPPRHHWIAFNGINFK